MQTDAIWQILPESIKEALKKGGISLDSFEEIRIRTQRPVSVRRKMNLFYLNQNGSLTKTLLPEMSLVIMSKAEMEQILLNASRFSVYAAEEQIRQGYLTIQGGHRIGICGEVILCDGKLQGIRKISSYNIRMAREVRGCAREIYPWLWEKERFLDTLIVSPPGLGKTTLLRDLVRLISDGTGIHRIPQNDVGQNTDVMDGGSKTDTMIMLLRTMAPQVLAADEAGGEEDIKIFAQAKKWGTAVLTTAHGTIKQHLFDQEISGLFSRYIEIQIDNDCSRNVLIYDQNRKLMTTVEIERSYE